MFFQNVLVAGEQVAILYILVAIGAIADKTGIYTEKVAKSCTDLLLYHHSGSHNRKLFFSRLFPGYRKKPFHGDGMRSCASYRFRNDIFTCF